MVGVDFYLLIVAIVTFRNLNPPCNQQAYSEEQVQALIASARDQERDQVEISAHVGRILHVLNSD